MTACLMTLSIAVIPEERVPLYLDSHNQNQDRMKVLPDYRSLLIELSFYGIWLELLLNEEPWMS